MLIGVGNLLLGLFLLVLGGLLSSTVVYLVAVVVALGFGAVVDAPLRELEKMHRGKYLLVKWMMLVLAIMNVPLLWGVERFLLTDFPAIPLGILYGIFFIVPHYYYFWHKMLRFPDFF